ncbi:MAG TPA: acyl-homoserine-lactone synthase [Rhizomicrobium sp.]|jgi:acyl-homoserine lactone synthase
MIDVVTSQNAVLYRNALEDMFRLRHRIFVEKMGWEALRKPDGIEKDQFDTPDAVYLILQDDDGHVIGSHRLLPTIKPHLFSELFPEMCNVRGLQRGAHIYELNRTCVDEDRLDRKKQEWARQQIIAGLVEFSYRAGIDHVTILTPLEVMFRYMLIGVEVKPLGLHREIDGVKQAAVSVTMDKSADEGVKAAFGIRSNIVRYIGAAGEDIALPSIPASIEPTLAAAE